MPDPTPLVAALPATVPFTGPETLERRNERAFILRLGANESVFGMNPAARLALPEIAAQAWKYNDPEGYDLRSAIATKHGIRIENIALGAGIDDLLANFVHAYISTGDVAVTTLGSYPTFDYVVAGRGGDLKRVPYGADERVDLEAMAATAHRTNAMLVYLANPDNPSGTWHPAPALTDFRSQLPESSLLLLDEAYSDFVPSAELPVILTDDPNVVRLRTFSKAHGMAGMRVGYAIAHETHVATLNKIRLHFAINLVAQRCATISVQQEADWIPHVVAETAAGRKQLIEGAQRLSIPARETRTNFVCLDFETKARAEAILNALLERGVFVRKPGLPPFDRYVRVTIADTAAMAKFLEILREIRLGH